LRRELDRLAERRRESVEEQHALDEATVALVHDAKAAGLAMTEVARRLGMSRESVYRYLRAAP
jgi:DNA-binding phage protein